ncbi:hypothetical protein Q1695_007142 [Nippostrongylus brasiliensis]|nr:hypothetical protein Q1695_007142 [Nippostrongylus brasiliensis]
MVDFLEPANDDEFARFRNIPQFFTAREERQSRIADIVDRIAAGDFESEPWGTHSAGRGFFYAKELDLSNVDLHPKRIMDLGCSRICSYSTAERARLEVPYLSAFTRCMEPFCSSIFSTVKEEDSPIHRTRSRTAENGYRRAAATSRSRTNGFSDRIFEVDATPDMIELDKTPPPPVRSRRVRKRRTEVDELLEGECANIAWRRGVTTRSQAQNASTNFTEHATKRNGNTNQRTQKGRQLKNSRQPAHAKENAPPQEPQRRRGRPRKS